MSENRVVALYRASTKQQTSQDKNDIPTQRNIVLEYIKNNNWRIIKEFTEGGISGYKVSANDRDALQEIKAMAIRGEFDILVVYMSDRLGRIADETPLIVKFLNENGVKVWSVSEGEISSDTHTDKLITFIRYWQNEGESIKTSKRVSDYQIASINEGKFRGGSYIPFGYMLIDQGEKNFKGRSIMTLVKNPEDLEIVKLIYHLSMKMNYGQSRIAKYLNENGYRNKKGKAWHATTIQYILANSIYKGQLHMNSSVYDKEILSPIREDLVIISPEEWEENRRIVASRSYKKEIDATKDKRSKNTHGKMLLNGLAFCGHCGCALTTMTAQARWKLADGTKKRSTYYKYRCASFYKKGAIKCEGQSTYGCTKIEPIVIEETKQFIIQLQEKNLSEEYVKHIENNIKQQKSKKDKVERLLVELETELKTLKNEIPKALLGKSNFSQELLKEALDSKSKDIELFNAEMEEINLRILELEENKDSYVSLDSELINWDNKFDEMDLDGKKAMLAAILDKVIVYRDNIELVFNVKFDTYKNSISCINTRLVRVLA